MGGWGVPGFGGGGGVMWGGQEGRDQVIHSYIDKKMLIGR